MRSAPLHWFLVAVSSACCQNGMASAPAAAPSGEDYDGGNAYTALGVLTFFIIALVLGILTLHLLVRFRIPYTALLLVCSLTPLNYY